MYYSLSSAMASTFLAVICIQGASVALWRRFSYREKIHDKFLSTEARLKIRDDAMFWIAGALAMEAGHDLIRAGYYVLRLNYWPGAWSFWFTFLEGLFILGLIRTFTRPKCGEWGWTIACILPTLATSYVLLR